MCGIPLPHWPFQLPENGLAADCSGGFHVLRSFGPWERASGRPHILLVPPLSGHFPALLRDMVCDLARDRRVDVIDWCNPCFVPVSAGCFDFASAVSCVAEAVRSGGPDACVIGLCQSVVPVLLAAAGAAEAQDDASLRAIVLIGGPVDPQANPAGTAALIRSVPLPAYRLLIRQVPWPYPGMGRYIFPASLRAAALAQYAIRHAIPGNSLWLKLLFDDGAAPGRMPFWQSYFAVMDLHADWFLETLHHVYFEAPALGIWQRQKEGLAALGKAGLMTIEGGLDDVVAPGQTHAAHRLCPSIPSSRRARLTFPAAGHFDLFHGRIWREQISPAIRLFLDNLAEP